MGVIPGFDIVGHAPEQSSGRDSPSDACNSATAADLSGGRRSRGVTRRRLLAGSTAALTGLAGCLGLGSDEDDDSDDGDGPTDPGEPSDDTDSDETGDEPVLVLGEVNLAGSTAFEGEITVSGERFEATGRLDGEDWYLNALSAESEQREETYLVDDSLYIVENDDCVEITGEQVEQTPRPARLELLRAQRDQQPERPPDEVISMDDETVAVYELTGETDEQVTYYVTVETGRLRRAEGEEAFLEYTWNGVDAIEPPDMDCR